MSALLAAARDLRALTEAQVDAAVALRGAELAALNETRTDALFALRVALAEGESTDGVELAAEARALAVAERRLASVCHNVVAIIERLGVGASAVIYGPTGRVGG